MTDEEKTLNSLLNTLGVPVAYMLFREPKPLPFIIYRGAGTFNLEADNVVFYSRKKYAIELYYECKNAELEEALETLLTENGFRWTKEEDVYIESERMYMTVYNI